MRTPESNAPRDWSEGGKYEVWTGVPVILTLSELNEREPGASRRKEGEPPVALVRAVQERYGVDAEIVLFYNLGLSPKGTLEHRVTYRKLKVRK